MQICCHVIQLERRVGGREGRQLSDQKELSECGCSGIEFFCFVMMQKVLPLLCEIMTATEFLVETLLWIQQLTQKVVCSSATLLPIPHPVEIYFEFYVTRYRQARKLAFVLVLIYLDFVCSGVGFFGLVFFCLFGCVFGFAWDFLFLFFYFWGEKKHSGCFPQFFCCVSLPSQLW